MESHLTMSALQRVERERKKPKLGKRIAGLLWDSLDDKSDEEHRLVRRLDSRYLIWACFYYFVMYLDSSTYLPHVPRRDRYWLISWIANVSNAYVSGMKEDLNMYGNQLNWMTTYWTIGKLPWSSIIAHWVETNGCLQVTLSGRSLRNWFKCIYGLLYGFPCWRLSGVH